MQPARKKIVIIGGGIQGVATAYYLTRHPKFSQCDVTLVEATGIASAASGKAGGFLALDWSSLSGSDALARASYNLHESLAKEENGTKLWDYRKLDTLGLGMTLSTSATKGTKTNKASSKIPSSLHWIENDAVTSVSKLGSTKTTAQVHPKKLSHFLYEKSKAAGVKYLYGTVTQINVKENAVESVQVEPCCKISLTASLEPITETSTIPATDVVLAAGPWSGKEYFPLLGLPISGARAHSVVIKPSKAASAHALFTELTIDGSPQETEIYARPDEVYICGQSDSVPLPASGHDVSYDPKRTQKLIDQAALVSPHDLSPSQGGKVTAQQACYLPMVDTGGGPLIGQWSPNTHKGIYVATGHSCWGILLSLGTGKVMSEILLDGEASSADVRKLAP